MPSRPSTARPGGGEIGEARHRPTPAAAAPGVGSSGPAALLRRLRSRSAATGGRWRGAAGSAASIRPAQNGGGARAADRLRVGSASAAVMSHQHPPAAGTARARRRGPSRSSLIRWRGWAVPRPSPVPRRRRATDVAGRRADPFAPGARVGPRRPDRVLRVAGVMGFDVAGCGILYGMGFSFNRLWPFLRRAVQIWPRTVIAARAGGSGMREK